MNCRAVRRRLSEYLDGQLTTGKLSAMQTHLDACELCARELAALARIKREASGFERKKAPDSLWFAIERELDATPENARPVSAGLARQWRRLADIVAGPAPAFKLAGVLAVLALGILIGRNWQTPPETEVGRNAAANAERVEFVSRTNAYVEKSKVLFLGLLNADGDYVKTSDWSSERAMAGELVREATYLRANMPNKRSERVRQLVEGLEMILFEIANLEEEQDIEAIDLIRGGIDRKGLMLKIDIHDLTQAAPAGDALM